MDEINTIKHKSAIKRFSGDDHNDDDNNNNNNSGDNNNNNYYYNIDNKDIDINNIDNIEVKDIEIISNNFLSTNINNEVKNLEELKNVVDKNSINSSSATNSGNELKHPEEKRVGDKNLTELKAVMEETRLKIAEFEQELAVLISSADYTIASTRNILKIFMKWYLNTGELGMCLCI
jgi:hypothetical protein